MAYRVRDSEGREIGTYTFQHPITEVAIAHTEYRWFLERLVDDLDVDHVYLSSVIGHALDAYSVTRPLTIFYHDYFPYCPALNIFFGTIYRRCEHEDLSLCILKNEFSSLFRSHTAEFWMELRESCCRRLLKRRAVHVVPSKCAAENLRRLDSRFESIPFHHIPHGIAFPRSNSFGGAEEGRRIRILIPGRLGPNKGINRFRRLLPYIRLVADVFLLGPGPSGDEFDLFEAVTVRRDYAHDELSECFRDIQPDLAVLLSEVPETFSHTLSELFAHAIPVVAPRMGSFSERIDSGQTGFLVEPIDDAFFDQILHLDHHREELQTVAETLQRTPLQTINDQIDALYHLRGDFLEISQRRLQKLKIRMASSAHR